MFNQKVDYKPRILAKLNEIEEYDPKGQAVSLNLISGGPILGNTIGSHWYFNSQSKKKITILKSWLI